MSVTYASIICVYRRIDLCCRVRLRWWQDQDTHATDPALEDLRRPNAVRSPWQPSFLLEELNKILYTRDIFFKLLNGVFRVKIFYIKVALRYHINPFFKYVIIKTQLITRYYHLVLGKTLNLHLHLQEIQTPPLLSKIWFKLISAATISSF